ncbi:MAG: hypothetical protein O3B80_03655 [Proteobacteria bacterium]|jgi:hypothetical protein|nr:hypothetical protein [Pseudomonadota bacterium]
MEYLFYTAIVAILGIVLYLGLKAISTGLDARNKNKNDGTLDQNRQDDYIFESKEDAENNKILEKLKDKNLSPDDLKKMYDEIQKKK